MWKIYVYIYIPIKIYFWQIKVNKHICILSFSTSDIICNVPAIPHGFVRNSKSSYKESEQLQFGCEEGYTFGERADALCTESGWHPTPYCTGLPFPKFILDTGCIWKYFQYYHNHYH